MCARTLCPLLSSTRNIALGRASRTDPSISMTPSFLAMNLLCYKCTTSRAGLMCRAQWHTAPNVYPTPLMLGAPALPDAKCVLRGLEPAFLECAEDTRGDLVDRTHAVDLDHEATLR